MKKSIYPLLSMCCVFAIGFAIPRFALANLSSEVQERHVDGAPFDHDCPSGMCHRYDDAEEQPAWPVSHSTQSEVVYVEQEIFQEKHDEDLTPVEREAAEEPDDVMYEEEGEVVELEPIPEEEPVQEEKEEHVLHEPRSSVAPYYMRLGIGLSIKDSDAEFRPVECGNGTSLACDNWTDEKQTFIKGTYGDAFAKEMGLGFNINSFLRFDATIAERSGFSFEEDRSARGTTAHFDTDAVDNTGDSYDSIYDYEMTVENTISNLTVMGSLYLDFFRRYSRDEQGMLSRSAISPYLGIGVGYARNEISDMTGEVIHAYDPNVDGTTDAFLSSMWRLEGRRSSGLAWMLTGGIGFALSEKTWLDISYRYLNLGDIETSRRYTLVMDTDLNDNGFSGNVALDPDDLDVDGDGNPDPGYMEYPNAGAQEFELDVHEISIGLRYEF